MIRLKRLYAHDFKQLREVEIFFPDAGRILVQGRNEAGKSTLFEAVFFALFAQALNTETGAKGLDDLIGYDKEKARVELDLAVRDRVFKIARTLVRGKANKWELDIVRPDGTFEEVRGNKAVNDRLVAELGFDADALLNTCFVEQKKLEKLEGMTQVRREESLSKLLNLERLLELQERFKLRAQDEKMLTRLEHRVELARAQAELPGVADELGRVEGQLRLVELRGHVENALSEMQAAAALDGQIGGMAGARASAQAAVERVDGLDQARKTMGLALKECARLDQDATELARVQAERDQLRRDEVSLPPIQQRERELRRLGVDTARLVRVEAVRGNATVELQRAQSQKQELDLQLERGVSLNAAVAEHTSRLAALEEKLRAYDIGDALGEWAAATQANASPDRGESAVAEKRAARDELAQATRKYVTYLVAIVVMVGAVGALFVPALALSTGNLLLAVMVALAAAVLATLAVILLAGRLIAANRRSSQLTQELGQLEGEANVRRTLSSAAAERVEAAGRHLAELGVTVPEAAEAALARRVELAATLENKTRAELSTERELVREKLNYDRATRDEVSQRINEMSPATDGANIPQIETRRDRAEELLNRWRPRLARRAAALNTGTDLDDVRSALETTRGERQGLVARLQQAEQLAASAARIETRMSQTRVELRELYTRAAALLNGSAPAWAPEFGRAELERLGAGLNAAFEAAGGETVRANLARLDKKFGALEREHAIRVKNAGASIEAARKIDQALAMSGGLPAEPTPSDLQAVLDRLESLNLEARAGLEARFRSLNQRLGELRGVCERFERELGLVGEPVHLGEAEAELAKERAAQLERKYSMEIVSQARRRIIHKVLPATMDYMRRILPQLTRDRYHDAELDPESFKIKVWDERAGQSGAWKEKNIFSGGTKDQFSLALRLAFALATLPQERGTSPGFIFLDEPLGSFDDERARALLYLLTEGEIGSAFDQIFLISHVAVQESKFTHHIRLEHGSIIETDLTPAS